MGDSAGRLVAGLALLVALWVVVYWLWEPGDHKALRVTAAPPETEQAESQGQRSDVHLPDRRRPDGVPDPTRLLNAASGPRDRSTRPTTDPADRQRDEGRSEPSPPPYREYIVRSGDTFGRIALRELGSSRHAEAIARANPLKDPTRLRVGETIRIPLDTENIQGRPPTPEPTPEERTYQVRAGDTLSAISQRVYGTTQYADFIFRMNRDQLRSPDSIRVGQWLRVPPPPDDDG